MKITDQQFKLRIPNDVKAWLAREAANNMRSQSAEIIVALKEKMERASAKEKGDEATA